MQGHVDTTATILSVTPDGNAKTFRFQPRDPAVLRYIVEKGFITVDGASLTVTKVQDGPEGWWEVMLIAYTQDRVVTAAKQPGDAINVEVDMVGKYVEKNVAAYFEDGAGESGILDKMISRIVEEKLKAAQPRGGLLSFWAGRRVRVGTGGRYVLAAPSFSLV